MPDDRRGPLVVGALTVATGAVLFLAAGDVLPVPDKTFGAPRWLAALLGLGVFFSGSYIVSLVLPTPWTRRLLGAAALLTFVTMGALLLTWHALAAGGPLVLSRDAPRIIVGAFFWIFALLLDAIAVVAWVVALRVLLHRPSP
ncbi:MAG: hypothetical protein DME04_10625 [Candidatus Rokuibacteriota bacterium]|nr:MAG: hypothetical protein DME04_10625 [Candidatus Rokubacteria bacterium]